MLTLSSCSGSATVLDKNYHCRRRPYNHAFKKTGALLLFPENDRHEKVGKPAAGRPTYPTEPTAGHRSSFQPRVFIFYGKT